MNLKNFEALLSTLSFTLKDKNYSKIFENGAVLTADFENEKLIYPDGLTVHEQQTCNFKQDENFVVFECVHRLLEKGYSPQSIELEPKWKLGHGASGGRADILVKDRVNNSLLIIECKTAGKEFEKAWEKTCLDGGQLLSYVQQERGVKFVCLYASDFKRGNLDFKNYIIDLNDDEQQLKDDLEKTEKRLFYKDATDVKQLYEVWTQTYNQNYNTLGIFEPTMQAYQIGIGKITYSTLKEISETELKTKFNEFAKILRTFNVSSKETAFDKLINLFLCKITDEITNQDDNNELKFYWRGEFADDYFDLIDRLQLLYKDGMKNYLGETITFIDRETFLKPFEYFKQDKNAVRDALLDLFKQQKYYTNSDFSFIDVHNEKLFNQNVEILLAVIKMWHGFRLTSNTQNQFLGNLFELFLDKGFKQSEGQFFTPIPICRFIISALPLKTLISENEKPPRVIDYACGCGHFLTEYANQIQTLIPVENKAEYFSAIYGVEKEYRLSKVAKISAFMYGQKEINVIYCDALKPIVQEVHDKKIAVENGTLDILIANPPFAVDGFLTTLKNEERENYDLLETVSEVASNGNIQCFFIERAKQLLAPRGIAAIIVPSSVLSNSDKTHIGSREILLKFFDIVALVELGSGTFGKTGTNTVVLFLRRKSKHPPEAVQYQNRVEDWFKPIKDGDEVYDDRHFIDKYCAHIGIPFQQYETLLNGNPSAELLAQEMFKIYQADFDSSSEIVNLKKQKAFSGKSETEKQLELEKRFLDYLRKIEKDKLYYFVLAYQNSQKVLIIKSPSDNKEQKTFLGYEWSERKGAEGIQLTTDSNGNHLTPLYDQTNRSNSEKINTLISQNFLDELAEIPEVLQPFVSKMNLVDMLDFSRKTFDKAISLTIKKSVEIETKWELVKLGDVCEVLIGGTPSRKIQTYFQGENLWVSISEMNGQIINDTKEKITDEGVQNSNVKLISAGTTLLSFKLSIGKTAIAGVDLYTNEAIAGLIPKDKNKLCDAYLFHLFNSKQIDLENTGFKAFGKSLNSTFLKDEVKIPLPPLEIQQQIVSECEAVDKNKALYLKEGMMTKDLDNAIKEAKAEILKKFL